MRLTSNLWHRIDHAARSAGQSFSAEVENRLNASFAVDDALTGPARQVIKHLIGAFGAETDVNDPAQYLGATRRIVEALASRYPGVFTTEEARELYIIAMEIGALNEHREMMAEYSSENVSAQTEERLRALQERLARERDR
ncbi:MAG: hypothetical protein JO058_01140 [Alphaproteobacteria bacterium]|nr:hypothetical protein [Alphaproteobacteria bacterium]